MASKKIRKNRQPHGWSLRERLAVGLILLLLSIPGLAIVDSALGCVACPCVKAPAQPEPCIPTIEDPCCPPSGGPGGPGGPPGCGGPSGPTRGGLAPGTGGLPCATPRPAVTTEPIYLRLGSVAEKSVDLTVTGPTFSWSQIRTYNGEAFGNTSLGGKWHSASGNFKIALEPGEGDDSYYVLVYSALSKRYITRHVETMGDPYTGFYDVVTYTMPNDCTYIAEESGNDFILTDPTTGQVLIFGEVISDHRLLKESTSIAWREANKDGTLYTYDVNNRITQITSPEGQDYNIVFSYSGDNISKIEVRTGADTSTRIQQVEYTYFDDTVHSSDLGGDGDLVQVKVSKLKTGGSVSTASDWIVRYTQYRYNSTRLITSVFEADAIQRLIDGRSDITDADDTLAKGDDDDNSGSATYKIKDYANRRFTYYTGELRTDNSGAGTTQDPKCVTVWNANGENLESKYGTYGQNEVCQPWAANHYLVKSEEVGACASCGSSSGGVRKEYFYLSQPRSGDNGVNRVVVEDTIDADGNGLYRTVYGLNEAGRMLRKAKIVDPDGTPQFWCESWKFVDDTGAKQYRLAEYRTPAAHNVTSSTIDEFLDPYEYYGGYANDTATLKASSGRIQVYEYDSNGFPTAEKVKKGNTGSAYYLWAADYTGGTNDNRKHLVTSRYVYPTATTTKTDSSRIQTQYSYTFWTGTDVVKTMTTTLPAIPTSQNGSGTSVTTTKYWDEYGRLRWDKDGMGYVTYYSYHPENGQLAYTVRDADPTSLPTSADGNSTKWVTSSDGSASSNKPTRGTGLATAIEQVAFKEFDSQGRVELAAMEDGTDGTVLARHYTVYETNRTLQFPYWDTSTNKPILPIAVTAFDDGGIVTEVYQVDPARTASASGKPTGLSTGTAQSHYTRWTRYGFDELMGERTKSQVYHDIPSSGYGTKDTNYAETVFARCAAGHDARVVAPGGTITRTVHDNLGRVASKWVGTDDTPSSGDWSPTNNSGANMTKVTEYEYDGDSAGGNGNRTKEIAYLTDDVEANGRITLFKYDWRDRLVFNVDAQEFDGKITYSRVEVDNTGRSTKSERYYDADDDSSFPDDGTVDAGDRLLGRTENLHDNLGRVYQTKTYAVDPDDGTVGSALVSDTWRDAAGQTIKSQAAGSEQLAKSEYDGLGRVVKTYVGYDTDETACADADDVTGDTIVEQSETVYNASGNAIQTTSYARKHTASGTGALTTTTARPNYSAVWHDGADRQTASADYGTNGASAFSRPSTAPARSDTVLVTSTEYNTAGRAYKATDPAAREDRQEFDDAGRLTKSIQNYTDGNPATGGADEDVTVERTYNSNGSLATLTAKNPTTGDQTTTYIYGTATGGITPEVYRNDLLRAEIYPDSDDTTSLGNGTDGTYDRTEYLYNRQGDRTRQNDQNGTIHEYVLDKSSRLTHDRVTTVGSGVDSAVLRISTAYDIRGMQEKVTSYDNATVGSGSAVNEVVFEYDDMGNLLKEYQEHAGAKDANTLYVQYNRDTTASSGVYTKGLRPTSVRYPNGRLVHTTYGTSGSIADDMNRLDAINADSSGSPGNSLAEYDYLGRGTIVVEDFVEPDVKLNFDSGTAGEYAGFDRFGRVVDQLWYDYGASANRDQYTYGYDRDSNRLYRENTGSSGLDEFYTYDDMNRLAAFDRGDLNANKDGITGTAANEEDWSLDMTGNWTDFVQKTSGTTDLGQDRTQNEVNEITGITATTGTNWADPVHDRNGNMTTVPKPSSLANGLTCEYDAWNRLVEVKDGATVIGAYEYDGKNRRVKRHVDTDAPSNPNGLDTYVHYFYNSDWQALETRETTLSSDQPEILQPKYQHVWSPRYVDSPVLCDENTDQDSLCDDERLYYLNDANSNVTTLVGTDGDAVERYRYEPYGNVTIYDGAWANIRGASNYANAATFTGRELDPETRFYYYRSRFYDADLGRFVSRDPIGYQGSPWNLYEYASSQPTFRLDPTGTSCLIYYNCIYVGQERLDWNTVRCNYNCIIDKTKGGQDGPPGTRTYGVGGKSCSPKLVKNKSFVGIPTNKTDVKVLGVGGNCNCPASKDDSKLWDDFGDPFKDCSRSQCKKEAKESLRAAKQTCRGAAHLAPVCKAIIAAQEQVLKQMCDMCDRK